MTDRAIDEELMKMLKDLTEVAEEHARAIDDVLRVLGKAKANPALLRSTLVILANIALLFSDLSVGELIDDVLASDFSEAQLDSLAKQLSSYGFAIAEAHSCPLCQAEEASKARDPARQPS